MRQTVRYPLLGDLLRCLEASPPAGVLVGVEAVVVGDRHLGAVALPVLVHRMRWHLKTVYMLIVEAVGFFFPLAS
jgi:hypothetical protein